MKRLSMAAVLVLAACAVQAQDAVTDDGIGFRAGVAAAFSDYSGDQSFPVEDSGLGVHVYGQVQVNEWLAFEAGYFNSGGLESDIENPLPGGNDGLSAVELAFSGFNVSALGYLPVFEDSETDIELYGKVGVYDYDIDITYASGNSSVGSSLGHTTGFLVGAGAILNITDNMGIRTSFDYYDVSNADLWSLGVGVELKF